MKKAILTMMTTAFFCFGLMGHARAMDGPGGVDIHGFIAQGFLISSEYNYLSHKSTDGSFEYNEMGINFSKDLTDKLRLGIQFFARDIGDAANNKVTLDWAYGDYRWRDWLGIRAGRIKLPLGLYNETRDYDFLRTSIVLPQCNYSDMLRDTLLAANGLSLYGNAIPLFGAGDLDYQVVMGALYADLDSGIEKYSNSALQGAGEIAGAVVYDTLYVGKIRWNTPLSGLALTADILKVRGKVPMLLLGNSVTMDSDIQHIRSGIEFTWEDLVLVFEYNYLDAENTTTLDANQMMLGEPAKLESETYYWGASYRFTDWFEVGAYYGVNYPDKNDKDGNDQPALGQPKHNAWQKDIALSLRFDIVQGWIFKLEGHKVNGTAEVLSVDNPDKSEEDWYYGAAKLTFSF
ncbi:MAG: hypothetical protein HKP58_01600 [Desulfatitalea sp.]|nr:hypothetical protein [Desulfatitalea sp.]NNJ99082.1 hypothetical protein [Desulfatitalea sp.]